MPDQVDVLEQILAKVQTVFGTAESSLVAADALEVDEGASISIDPRIKEIALIGGGFTQNQSIVGPRDVSLSMSMPMRTGNSEGDQGQLEALLRTSCLKSTDTDTDTDTTDDRFAYALTSLASEWEDMTVWGHSGNLDSGDSMIYKVQNVMGNSKISLDFDNALATISYDGKGVLVDVPAFGTQASVTPNTVVTPPLASCTIDFFGDANYIPVSIDFDFGVEVSPTLKPTVASGLGKVLPSRVKAKWSAKIFHDSNVNPYTPLFNGTLGTISVAWGTEPNKFTVSTAKAQITSCNKTEQNGITCYDVSGILVDNDLTVQIDTAEA